MKKMTVDPERCKGCGLCISVCPKKVIEADKNVRNKKGYCPARCIDQEKCIACAMCYTMCPDCAITLER